MNSNRSSCGSLSVADSKYFSKTTRQQEGFFQKTRIKLNKKLASKYCTCENYMTINQINRTIAEKQCILKTTINDIRFDYKQQNIQQYYPSKKSQSQLPQLIEYYKYYSQKSVLYMKEFFPLIYQYQEKRKVIEYKRLKVLLNLSDSQEQKDKKNKKNQYQISGHNQKSRVGISRNFHIGTKDSGKQNGYKGIYILEDLSQSLISKSNQNQESLLINRLRNNLSKHIGPSKVKNLTIEQLDRKYDFTKKNDFVVSSKQKNDCFFFPNGKSKPNTIKSTKFSRQHTHTNTPDQNKLNKGNIRRRSAKRNNSCQNFVRFSAPKNPYESCTSKLRRKKNLSMDNIYTHTSTPYILEEKRDSGKMKRINIKSGQKQRVFRQKQNMMTKGPQTFMQSISDLKNKIKKQKQKMIKASCQTTKSNNTANFSSLKREKVQYSSISGQNMTSNGSLLNTANQRFTKKNYEKLREKTVDNFY